MIRFFLTETKSVYCAVRNSSLYKPDYFSSLECWNSYIR